MVILLNYIKIEIKIKNNFYYMINIKYKKKNFGLLIKGINIFLLKLYLEIVFILIDRVMFCLVREMYMYV